MRIMHTSVPKGNTSLNLTDLQGWPEGVYSLKVILGENLFTEKIVVVK